MMAGRLPGLTRPVARESRPDVVGRRAGERVPRLLGHRSGPMMRTSRAPTATDIAAGPSKVDGAKPAETPPRSDSTPQPATNDLRAILRAEFLALRESIR